MTAIEPAGPRHAERIRILSLRLAPGLFVLLWATGFIGARLTMPHAEPMTFLALRFGLAAAVMAVIARALGISWPRDPALVLHTVIAGLLIHAIYLGGVFTAVRAGLEAGASALIVGAQPVLTAALAAPLLGERVGPRKKFGLLLGTAGVVVFVGEKLQAGLGTPLSVAFCVLSLFAIALGTVYQKRFVAGVPIVAGVTIQYAASFVACAVLALALETGTVEWTGSFLFGLAWLTLVLSIGAVSLLYGLIRRGAAANVASLFFLVPPVAALMGYLLFGESLGLQALLGMALVALGVWLVNARAARGG